MSDSTADRIEGGFNEAKGNLKEGWGEATGDEQARAEGKMDQVKGHAQQKIADAKDAVDDAVRNITDR